MKAIFNQWENWLDEKNEDYVYDEIHQFYNDLPRDEALALIEYAYEQFKGNDK